MWDILKWFTRRQWLGDAGWDAAEYWVTRQECEVHNVDAASIIQITEAAPRWTLGVWVFILIVLCGTTLSLWNIYAKIGWPQLLANANGMLMVTSTAIAFSGAVAYACIVACKRTSIIDVGSGLVDVELRLWFWRHRIGSMAFVDCRPRCSLQSDRTIYGPSLDAGSIIITVMYANIALPKRAAKELWIMLSSGRAS